MNEPLISIKDLTVTFNGTQALCEVDLDIYRGEFIGICGPNGSGKTTLLRAILGLVQPDSGSIFIEGTSMYDAKNRFEIGYVPQLRAIDSHFPARVKDVVMMGRTPKIGFFKRPSSEDQRIVNQVMKDVGLDNIARQPIGKISGGQFQKVLLARALTQQPKILLLDEPTSALDFRMTASFMELVKKLNEENNLTILSVHHDLQLLKEYASRIICMDRAIEWEGSPDDANLEKELLRLFFYNSPH